MNQQCPVCAWNRGISCITGFSVHPNHIGTGLVREHFFKQLFGLFGGCQVINGFLVFDIG